jgi:scyllo-inosamine-4-phosphate amidinotransferase 1
MVDKIHSDNEWGQLKRVIVGTADYANWPGSDSVFADQIKYSRWQETDFKFGPVDQHIIDRANQSLERFANLLTGLGVEVSRPQPRNYQQLDQFYGYCPRDTVLIIGDRIIRAPTLFSSRRHEWETLQHTWNGHTITVPDDPAAMFDAANICRLGQDILYLVSPTGNLAGAQWLQDFLGKEYRVHILDNIYNGVHIDSTISPVREGLVVLNASRVNNNNLPAVFKDWDKIWMQEDELVVQPFDHYPYASNWIGLNFLMVNERLAIIDPKQKILQFKLNANGIETIGVDLTESRNLGGAHHCCTLDLLRL